MTVTDRLIPIYVWLVLGFGVVSLFIAIINFGMIILLYLKNVLGLDTPSYALPVLAAIAVMGCTAIGLFFITYNIQGRMLSYLNQQANPEIAQIAKDVKWLREQMESKK